MSSKEESLCDEKVYSGIFYQYSKTLYNYLYYKCGDTALAKDIMQESFLKLWVNCKSIIFNTAQGYVFTTANNLLSNVYKHEKVKLRFQKNPNYQPGVENPEFLLEEKEWRDEIEKAISDLPEKQRVVFLMSRIDKKTYKEIAQILEISKQAVEKRMYNALDVLRRISKNIK